jgi:hypothetical protein
MDAPRRRDGVLQELAVALAEAGSVMEAERIARRIQTENDKANALAEIAVVLVKQGNTEDSARLLDETGAARLAHIRAEYLRKGGDLKAADELAHSIQDSYEIWTQPSRLLYGIDIWLVSAGRFREAFDARAPRDLIDTLQALSGWLPAFEKAAAGCAVEVLRTSLRLATWRREELSGARDAMCVARVDRYPSG